MDKIGYAKKLLANSVKYEINKCNNFIDKAKIGVKKNFKVEKRTKRTSIYDGPHQSNSPENVYIYSNEKNLSFLKDEKNFKIPQKMTNSTIKKYDNLESYSLIKNFHLPSQCAIKPSDISVSHSSVSNASNVIYVGILPLYHPWTLKNVFYPGVIRYAMNQANMRILTSVNSRIESLTTKYDYNHSLMAQTNLYISNASAFIGFSGFMEASLASAWNLPLIAFVRYNSF